MTNPFPDLSNNLQEVHDHYTVAITSKTQHAITEALADIPFLTTEIHHLRLRLAIMRLARANMIAAARATLAATGEGENDPLWYLRDELSAQHRLDTGDGVMPW